MIAAIPFWQRKRLHEMSPTEWESLCDGCGKCCLAKLEDEDTGEVYHTDLVCRYMDQESCQCTVYATRLAKVPGCTVLTPATVGTLHEGRPLADWHPLVSGDADSVHAAGVSVRHRVLSEDRVPEEDWEEHIIHWVL